MDTPKNDADKRMAEEKEERKERVAAAFNLAEALIGNNASSEARVVLEIMVEFECQLAYGTALDEYPMLEDIRLSTKSCMAAIEGYEEGIGSSVNKLLILMDDQINDEGLWFDAETAPEAYLQKHLRELHRAVERLSKDD